MGWKGNAFTKILSVCQLCLFCFTNCVTPFLVLCFMGASSLFQLFAICITLHTALTSGGESEQHRNVEMGGGVGVNGKETQTFCSFSSSFCFSSLFLQTHTFSFQFGPLGGSGEEILVKHFVGAHKCITRQCLPSLPHTVLLSSYVFVRFVPCAPSTLQRHVFHYVVTIQLRYHTLLFCWGGGMQPNRRHTHTFMHTSGQNGFVKNRTKQKKTIQDKGSP